jgi:ATP-dependent RNA helicase RhlE
VSFQSFSFESRIERGIQAAGYLQPTPIQAQAIPLVLSGRDVMGLAQTGTGKTAAFMLPILQRLYHGPRRRIRALIVAPTRELAEQIHRVGVELGQYTRVESVTVYGGVGKNPQVKALRRGVEIVVACPGRLLDLIGDGAIDLSGVEVLVLDEADRMCDMGFLPDIRRILKHLPRKRQTLFFSATMPDEIRELSSSILNSPATVQIGHIAPAETVSHALYPVHQSQKKRFLLTLLSKVPTGRTLVFTRTKYRARNLARDLAKKGYNAVALQGNMSQNQRQRAIDGFRNGKYDILAATDIAARGIDVADISHVINFDMPDTVDAYTHRIGRTGRVEKSGEALTLAVQEDDEMVCKVERALGEPIQRRQLDGFDYANLVTAKRFLTPERVTSGRRHAGDRTNANGRGKRNSHRRRGAGRQRRPRGGARDQK